MWAWLDTVHGAAGGRSSHLGVGSANVSVPGPELSLRTAHRGASATIRAPRAAWTPAACLGTQAAGVSSSCLFPQQQRGLAERTPCPSSGSRSTGRSAETDPTNVRAARSKAGSPVSASQTHLFTLRLHQDFPSAASLRTPDSFGAITEGDHKCDLASWGARS